MFYFKVEQSDDRGRQLGRRSQVQPTGRGGVMDFEVLEGANGLTLQGRADELSI